jgi:hypothetical protein
LVIASVALILSSPEDRASSEDQARSAGIESKRLEANP